MKRLFLTRVGWTLACIASLSLGALSTQAQTQPAVYNFSPVNQFGINLTAAYWNPIIAYVREKWRQTQPEVGRTSADTTSYVLAKEVDFVFSNHLFSPEREQLGWKVLAQAYSQLCRAKSWFRLTLPSRT